MSELQQIGFNYAALPAEIALKAQLAATSIKLRLKRTVEDIIDIGRELTAVKDELPHGQFEFWIKDEFQMNREMANSFMQVANRFGSQMSDYLTFKPTVLYALAAPSTPDAVVEKAIAKAESGEKVTVADVRDWKALEAQLAEARQRNEDWRKQNKANRDKINELELELIAAKKHPAPAPEVQVVEKAPADYEAAKALAQELAKDLDALKKKQADLVQQQVSAKLREREKEIADLDRQAKEAESRLASLNKQIDSYSSKERMTRLQRELIEKTRSQLVDLASHFESLPPLEDDPETARLWDALADMLRNAALAVDCFRGRAHPGLPAIRASANLQ